MANDWIKIADGSYGSRKGQPWSRELSEANDRSSPSDTSAGVHGAVVAPSKEALRAAIESQTCPWCGRGPFKMLASHTNREHGIDRVELRDLAGLPRRSSICSPETSEISRRALVERPDYAEMRMRGAAIGQKRGVDASRVLTAARYQEAQHERDAEIISAVQAGKHRKQVALDFGVTYPTVLRVLKRHGMDEDGRKARARERGALPAAAREATERRQAQMLGDRKARWAELGGNHEALIRTAKELGIDHKTLRAYFKKAGLPVPDGRLK